MTLNEFVAKYNGQSLTDNHGNFKGECVSLAKRYAQEVQDIPNADAVLRTKHGSARDLYEDPTDLTLKYYDRIPYGQARKEGDLVVWGGNLGLYGDVAVALDSNRQIFGQLGTPIFKPANVRIEVREPLGYLRKKVTMDCYPKPGDLQNITNATGWQKGSDGKTTEAAIAYWCNGTGNSHWGNPGDVAAALAIELFKFGQSSLPTKPVPDAVVGVDIETGLIVVKGNV